MNKKKILFSSMQSTGNLTLGNYLGVLKNLVKFSKQNKYKCFYGIADTHSITIRQNPKIFHKKNISLFILYIASGIDPNNNCIFFHSQIKEHMTLSWILNCYSYFNELKRMTQFKNKINKNFDNVNAGLFTYPVLMAADILLYNANIVPIGFDQIQHLELIRNIAIRFNNIYGKIFTIPEYYIDNISSKIMGLKNPLKKMSKSDKIFNNNIYLTDTPDIIMYKCKHAITDSKSYIDYDKKQPGIKNLINIYCSCTNKTINEALNEFYGQKYEKLKNVVAEVIINILKPIQNKIVKYKNNKSYINLIIKKNLIKARYFASKTLNNVYKAINF